MAATAGFLLFGGGDPALAGVFHPVLGAGGMVSTQEAIATREGVEVLRRGGNAVDAAVTVALALAVTLPEAGNLGGGGFMLIHLASGRTTGVDFREMAPAAAHRDIFLNEAGEPDAAKSRSSALAVGVPGTVRGLQLALERYGTIPWAAALAPAIRLAREGFPVTHELAAGLAGARKQMEASPAAITAFFKPDGTAYAPGEILRQPDLARTLEELAQGGPGAFYTGGPGKRMLAGLSAWGGCMTAEDLAAYRAVEREPVRASYRGHEVVTMAPPSSGVIVLECLNILENFPLAEWGQHSARAVNAMAEAMKFGFADRAEFLGDSEFTAVPLARLLDPSLAAARAAAIRERGVVPAADVKPAGPLPVESPHTTHYSVMDAHGNAVAATTTLNLSYGCGFMAPGTGFLLNNEMDDFSSKPGSPNAFGLVGAAANAIAPRKRMASSMSPTIVLRNGRPCLATGSPGGSRIISVVLQVLVNVIEHRMNVAEATCAPRVHHQWQPDELRVEGTLSRDTVERLRELGYRVEDRGTIGVTQSIYTADGRLFEGASDPRRDGALTLPVR